MSRLTFAELAGLLCFGLLALYASVVITITEGYVASAARLSADARYFAHECTRGTGIFDTRTGRTIFSVESGWHPFFSPSSMRIGLSRGEVVQVRALPAGDIEHQLAVGEDSRRVEFVDDDTLVVVKPTSLEHWSISEARRTVASRIEAQTRNAFPEVVAVAPDGRRVAFGDSCLRGGSGQSTEWHYDIDVWEIGEPARHWKLIHNLKGSVFKLAFSRDGRFLAAYDSEELRDSRAKLWDLDSGEPPESIPIGASHGFAFSPDSSYLAIADWNWPRTTIRVWEKGQATLVDLGIKDAAFRGPIDTMNFQPDGTGVVTGDLNGTIEWWTINPPALATRITGLALSPRIGRWWWASVAVYFSVLTALWFQREWLGLELSPDGKPEGSEGRAGLLLSTTWSLINAGALLCDKRARDSFVFPDTGRTFLSLLFLSVFVVGIVATLRLRGSAPPRMLNLALLISACVAVVDVCLSYLYLLHLMAA